MESGTEEATQTAEGASECGGLKIKYAPQTRRSPVKLLEEIRRYLPPEGANEDRNRDARLSLLVIDPVNAALDGPEPEASVRDAFAVTVSAIRNSGGNLLLITGEKGDETSHFAFSTASCTSVEAREKLLAWIGSREFQKTLQLFHDLCAPAHQKRASHNGAVKNVHPQAPEPWGSVCCRQWYTSLLHWFALDSEKTKGLVVCALPSRVAISGEWFLGVWAHSAVPLVGLKIIETLTTPEAQLERRAERLGLPVDPSLCTPDEALLPNADVELRNLDVRDLLDRARRRSGIHRYAQIARTMADNLGCFLSTAVLDESLIRKTVESMQREVGAIVRD